MKTTILCVTFIVIGMSIGFGITWAEFSSVNEQFLPSTQVVTTAADGSGTVPAPDTPEQAPPKLELLNETTFDFGTMEKNAGSQHTFRIKNVGEGVLTIKPANVSCGQCVQPKFESFEVKGGEVGELPVEFFTRKDVKQFDEGFEIRTNDRQNPYISFRIQGFVTREIRPEPDRVLFQGVTAHKDSQQRVRLYTYRRDDLEIEDVSYSNSDVADFFAVTHKTLSPEQIAEESHAIGGVEVVITVKKGMPLGPIRQSIRLKTNFDEQAKLEIPIEGNVVSDVSLLGPKFDDENNIVLFGPIDRDVGESVTLRMIVKGPYQDKTKISVGSIHPTGLQVSIGERKQVNETVCMYPITITVPTGLEAVNFLGPTPDDLAKIVLKTTHPFVKEVPIRVRFAIE